MGASTEATIQTTIWVLNGPNLNLLGRRRPDVYGSVDLAGLEQRLTAHAQRRGLTAQCRQSNHEGQLIDWLHQANDDAGGVILNAGAYTHSSIALHDAVEAIAIPVIEVHLSNIHAREPFRHTSLVAPQALGVIAGFGVLGYELALDALAAHLSTPPTAARSS
ncbi:MAG: type II 3-dehydroquinate dehydratase [Rhodothalassiaceae bacterium]